MKEKLLSQYLLLPSSTSYILFFYHCYKRKETSFGVFFLVYIGYLCELPLLFTFEFFSFNQKALFMPINKPY